MSKRVMRALAEKEIKRMLIELAKKANISLQELADWVYYEAGIRVRPVWSDIERKIMRSDIDPQAFAAFLIDQGVEIDEEEWIRILDKYAGLEEPRYLRRGVRSK